MDSRTYGYRVVNEPCNGGLRYVEAFPSSEHTVEHRLNIPACTYLASSQMFLTPDVLFILVVDLFAYSDVNSRKDALEQWLDILQSRVPGSVVLIVGTHIDYFASSGMRSERIESFKRGSLI